MSSRMSSGTYSSSSRRSARRSTKEAQADGSSSPILEPGFHPSPALKEQSRLIGPSDEFSNSESEGIGLGIDGEFEGAVTLRRRDAREENLDLDSSRLHPREYTLSSAFLHQYSAQPPEPLNNSIELRAAETSQPSQSSSAPTFFVVFGLIVLVLVLGYSFRQLSTYIHEPQSQPRLDDVLARYLSSIGVHVVSESQISEAQSKNAEGISVSAKYWQAFKSAFRVLTCHKPHTILFFSPDARKSKKFMQEYIEAFYGSVPSLYIQGDEDEYAFRSKLETFLLERKSASSSCPAQFVILDASRGLSDRNRNMLEPALDDTLAQIDLNGENLSTTRVAFIIIREFSRSPDLSSDWRSPLVEEWTGRFVQRLRNVVGYEA